jgi:hypothetical protein
VTRNIAEHFAAGVGPEHQHLLGTSKPINSNAHQDAIYQSEYDWSKNASEASKLLNLKQARKFGLSVIHHSSLDDLPNIAEVRKNFSDKSIVFNKKLTMRDAEGRRGERIGMMATGPNGPIIVNPKVGGTHMSKGELTHELTHTILHNGEFGSHPGHNWAFAKLHTHIVHNIFGEDAAKELTKHYKANGVDL